VQTSHTSSCGIHWIEQGPGRGVPAVVLLHGLGGDAKFWAAEQAWLARDFRVLAIDLRGSGRSVGSGAAFSMDALAEDVLHVLDEAGLPAAHVVGFSLGGAVAQATALAAPERVASLVLAATFPTVNAQARLYLRALATLFRSGASSRQMYELIVPWLFSVPFLSGPRAAPHLQYVEDPTDLQTPADWLRLLDALLGYDGTARLGDIRMPTLVLAGDEDRLASPADARQLAEGIPAARLEVLPGGHLVNVESQEAFIGHIARFLADMASR
jgi:pimeloyl-ACP methyl ester carboxylesterase